MHSFLHHRGVGLVTICAVVFLATLGFSQVKAAPMGASSAYGLQADLSIIDVVDVGVGPFASASGTSPAAYNNSSSLLSVDESLTLLSTIAGNYAQGLSTGLIETNANSSIPGPTQAAASAQVNDLDLGLVLDPPILNPLTILGLSADTIVSSSEVVESGGLIATGDTLIEGLSLGGLFLDDILVDIGLAVDPLPNTVLLDLLGLRIVLNEQIESDLGGDGLGLRTNALHLSFEDFLLGGSLLNGDIVVASSYAEVALLDDVADVPEPAALGLFAVGLLGAGLGLRRRRRQIA